jgi:hypothetical protein
MDCFFFPFSFSLSLFLICRHFATQNVHIPRVFQLILGETGLRNERAFVRSRASYVLMTVTKSARAHLQPLVPDIVAVLLPLLHIELPTDHMVVTHMDQVASRAKKEKNKERKKEKEK